MLRPSPNHGTQQLPNDDDDDDDDDDNLGNIQRCTSTACYTAAPLYNIIIIFNTVVTQKPHFKHEK